MKNKLEKIKKEFKNFKYNLTNNDIKDLERQLERKPLILYFTAIKWLLENGHNVTYENTKNLLKDNIKMRWDVWKFITSIEESVRAKYLEFKYKEKSCDIKKYQEVMEMNFYKITDDLKFKNEVKSLEEIRYVRNKVSHICYLIIFDQTKEIIEKMIKIKDKYFINNYSVNKLLDSITKKNNLWNNKKY